MPEVRNENSNAYISGIRTANIRLLIKAFHTQADFCRAISKGESQVSQFFADPASAGHRQIGGIVARDIEKALELPANCMDRVEGVLDFIPELTRKWRGELSARQLRSEMGEASSPSRLSSLHMATLDAMKDAMLAGKVTQADCLALLNRWAAPLEDDAAPGAGERPRGM